MNSIIIFSVLMVGQVDGFTADKEWYLSRLLYESQVRKDFTQDDYLQKKMKLEKMTDQEARIFIGAYKIRAKQREQASQSFRQAQDMRIQQIIKQREMSNQRVTRQHAWFYPYTLPYQYRPNYPQPYYFRPYYSYPRYNYHFHWR